jgi:hypothetical protein
MGRSILARTAKLAPVLSLALLLADCSNFDPTDIMDDLFAAQKKPLTGDRKELFPGGTPGVSQGLPPELVKGYQPPPPDTTAQAPDQGKPKAKAKAKPATDPSASASTPQAAQSVTR